jgi:hypothetical protein
MKLTVGLEGAARFEDGLPLHGVDGSADFFTLGQEDVVLEIEDARGAVGALEIGPEGEKIPAFAVEWVVPWN